MTTKKRSRLTLKDRLSRLSYLQACKLLGENAKQLIQQGGKYDIDLDEQVRFTPDAFRLDFTASGESAVVTIAMRDDARERLGWSCTACEIPCVHAGAAFSLILEEKMALRLAAAPQHAVPVESLGEDELVERALQERAERARREKMKVRSSEPSRPWTDYTVTSAESGKTYRVALRGRLRGQSYCSCPDFRSNTLGTCKHIMHLLNKIERRFPESVLRRAYRPKKIAVHLLYGDEVTLRMEVPRRLDASVSRMVKKMTGVPIADVGGLLRCVTRLEKMGEQVTIYPDAEQFIQQRLFQQRIDALIAEVRRDPRNHPLRTKLLKTELLPYQLDGVAFAAGAGRAVLADDMGLGKTIQGVGVAEMLALEAGISKVLVVCPASLKSQWRNEIRRFSDRDCQLILGGAAARAEQYDNECFFTICNYEQVLRDVMAIERVGWDLIILDEGQRIKNWASKTSNVIKSLKSPFALVLSGTPLENRLDELYSVVQFIDDRRLSPAFRFFNRHRVTDENGRVLGYKNLSQLRENLRPVLLRRTRETVLTELPPRMTEIIRIAPTDEQRALHVAHMQVVACIIRKRFLSEMDLLRLQRALLMCRLAANGTYLVNKKRPAFSSKLDQIDELVARLFQENDRKAVLFSEWTTMLDLIQGVLKKHGLEHVRLDGSVPQKVRQQLVHRFQHDRNCKLFLATNAGSTGLNLQAANTVINVDLPWNPAVLEQRIGRVHRMGQVQPVQVFVLVTEETLEENLLATLSSKHDLALAALDADSEVDQLELHSGMEELKRRLEVLLGAKPEAPVDESVKLDRKQELERFSHRERVAAAGGELLGAAFQFLGELISDSPAAQNVSQQVATELTQRLAECVKEDESGRQQLTVTLPNRAALDTLAQTLARLLAVEGSGSPSREALP